MSGFNTLIEGESLETKNNGALTGKEIYYMNLDNVELVALSACETAKNNNANTITDEAWNLIKSFKLAGVKSFLTSLWKVDNAATCLLMTEFYRN